MCTLTNWKVLLACGTLVFSVCDFLCASLACYCTPRAEAVEMKHGVCLFSQICLLTPSMSAFSVLLETAVVLGVVGWLEREQERERERVSVCVSEHMRDDVECVLRVVHT